ncbi:MAG TPA: 3-dehydroquinate synthase [Candidatus Krumholzibacteria bacterium]|nr:3-dehydroquinate synthase [Candidatus Krumholzibacteria bacterium]HPD72214.1 3-dehydroquinate synthase [Candidatus Krumholzibacteria bacterium]HRY40854.1 3-dehydroquinate synthase [Candidatus Krumholzibacteria bacterium]
MSDAARNLVVVGFMGTGKTAVGRELAALLERPFIDLDDVIAERAGRSISGIFAAEGEAGFRDRERAAVAGFAEPCGCVLATGGGVLLDPRNRDLLAAGGDLVLLRAAPAVLAERLAADRDRPLLRGATDLRARIEDLLAARERAYTGCPYTLDTSELAPNEAAVRIAAMVPLGLGERAIPIPGAAGHPALAARDLDATRVITGRGAACRLGLDLRRCGVEGRVVVMLPEVVRRHYQPRLGASLAAAGLPWAAVTVRDGDAEKTFAQVAELVEELAALGADRGTCVVAAGGGVTGDLVGFAAAVYMRGITLAMVPTTLLAMVDAHLGGKTGVNGARVKNLAGAFHPPVLVAADPSVLATLPDRELANGYAEVVKTALIGDPALFARLESELAGERAGAVDPRRAPALLEACVAACAAVKGGIVGRDPWELGERRLLNLGHTLGHALEAQSEFGLSHGEAVSLGLVAALRLAVERGAAAPELLARTRRVLRACGLPTVIPAFDPVDLRARLRLDKKNRDGRLRFVMPLDVGRVTVAADVSEDEALAALAKEQACASS